MMNVRLDVKNADFKWVDRKWIWADHVPGLATSSVRQILMKAEEVNISSDNKLLIAYMLIRTSI